MAEGAEDFIETKIPDIVAAREFLALFGALRSDDFLATHIALNDFTTMPDEREPFIRQLAKAWIERDVVLTGAVKDLPTSLKIPSPVGERSAVVLSATRTQVTIDIGTGSQQVNWSTWSAKQMALMWTDLAEMRGYRLDCALIAVQACWLAHEPSMSRVIAGRYDKSLSAGERPAASMLRFVHYAERWLAAAAWESQHLVANVRKDATMRDSEQWLALLKRMPNPLVDAEMNAFIYRENGEPLDVKSIARDPIAQPIVILPGVSADGAWTSHSTGARCTGAGSCAITLQGSDTDVEITFTPRRFAGAILVTLKPYEWALDLDHSTVAMRGPRGTTSAIPVTILPRQVNRLRLRLPVQEGTGGLGLNHDPVPLAFSVRKKPDMVRIALGNDADFVLHAISRSP